MITFLADLEVVLAGANTSEVIFVAELTPASEIRGDNIVLSIPSTSESVRSFVAAMPNINSWPRHVHELEMKLLLCIGCDLIKRPPPDPSG